MGILSRVEAFLERLFEAPAGRLGARLQPVSLGKRIERAMDTNKSFRDDGIVVPNHYDLHLNPTDFAGFASYRSSLEDDLAHDLLARARSERYSLVARPRVRITADPSIPAGRHSRCRQRCRRGGRPSRAGSTDGMPGPTPWSSAGRAARRRRPSRRRARTCWCAPRAPAGAVRPGRRADQHRAARSDNDVIVDDPLVSRHHCQLKLQHGAYSFADLGSRNGSFVTGSR